MEIVNTTTRPDANSNPAASTGPSDQNSTLEHRTLPRTSLDPIPFPTTDDSHDYSKPIPRPHGRASSASSASTLRPFSSMRPQSVTTGTVDPYTAYARRTSLIFTPAHGQPTASVLGDRQSGSHLGPPGSSSSPSYVVPMRSRTASSDASGAIGPGQLLRTLSTGGLSTLVEKRPGEGVAGAITQADLPPSALPTEFKRGKATFDLEGSSAKSSAKSHKGSRSSPRSGTSSRRSSTG